VSGAIDYPSVIDWMQGVEVRLKTLERMPSGAYSIGMKDITPFSKNGAPTDADLAYAPPIGSTKPDVPLGITCWDWLNGKWWIRTAGVTRGAVVPPATLGPVTVLGVWKSVTPT
jgi:hypothetical protein